MNDRDLAFIAKSQAKFIRAGWSVTVGINELTYPHTQRLVCHRTTKDGTAILLVYSESRTQGYEWACDFIEDIGGFNKFPPAGMATIDTHGKVEATWT